MLQPGRAEYLRSTVSR